MDIEVVDFYPDPKTLGKRILMGSMHVYVIDLGMDIRGVHIKREGKYSHIFLPHKIGIEEGKKVMYPIIAFTDPEKEKDFRSSIIGAAKQFMKKWKP